MKQNKGKQKKGKQKKGKQKKDKQKKDKQGIKFIINEFIFIAKNNKKVLIYNTLGFVIAMIYVEFIILISDIIKITYLCNIFSDIFEKKIKKLRRNEKEKYNKLISLFREDVKNHIGSYDEYLNRKEKINYIKFNIFGDIIVIFLLAIPFIYLLYNYGYYLYTYDSKKN